MRPNTGFKLCLMDAVSLGFHAQVFGGLFGPAQIADGNYNGFADRIVGAIWTALMVLHSAGARRCARLTATTLLRAKEFGRWVCKL